MFDVTELNFNDKKSNKAVFAQSRATRDRGATASEAAKVFGYK
jgi:hypothetical protein